MESITLRRINFSINTLFENAHTYLTPALIILLSVIFIKYVVNWILYNKKANLPGPFSLPLIGSAYELWDGYSDLSKSLLRLCEKYPPVFKVWVGSQLFILNSKPEDLEVILNNSLEKNFLSRNIAKNMFSDSLLLAPVNIWKRHRKIISNSFSSKMLDTYINTFFKHSNLLVKDFEAYCGNGQFETMTRMLKCTLDIVCENMADVDLDLVRGQYEYNNNLARLEELIAIRCTNILTYYSDIFWNLTSMSNEFNKLCSETFSFCKQILKIKSSELPEIDEADETNLTRKRLIYFWNRLNEEKDKFTDVEILEELQLMLMAGSDTTGTGLSVLMLAMGIHQDVQEKVYEEVSSIFGGSMRRPTLQELNKMEYTERVINETLRLAGVVAFIVREPDQDLKIDSVVYPKGCAIVIPLIYIHVRKDLWDDPFTFNPDRFLPENIKSRHRCAFIPFSFGPRNCIGFRYAMASMKIILANIIMNYKIFHTNYKSLRDIEFVNCGILQKPKDGAWIAIEKRSNNQ